MPNDRIPSYFNPARIQVPADGVALVGPNYLFFNATNPLPVVTEVPVPGIYDIIPFYMDPNNIAVPAEGVAIVLSDGTIVGPGNPMPVTGGGGGSVAASDVTVTNDGFDNAQEIFDYLLYVPIDVTVTGGGSANEVGASVASVHLTWSVNKDPTSQSLNQGVGSIPETDRDYTFTGPYTSNQTFTITASDGSTSDSASANVTFQPKRYWGPWPDQSPDNAEILTLSQELTSSRAKSISYDCTGGRYPIYVYPKSFGALAGVTVGGLAFSAYSLTEISLTNAQGFTQDYYLFAFDIIQTGAAINVVFS